MVEPLLNDLAKYSTGVDVEVILTFNVPEELHVSEHALGYPLKIIRNPAPQGFGANHNQAFLQASGEFFCVLNPDVRLSQDVFLPLSGLLANDCSLGVAAPQVKSSIGENEDNARCFPRPMEIFRKAMGVKTRVSFPDQDGVLYPDWVAGMFMLYRAEVFREIGGFDSRYFLYYEDVDICARLLLSGYKVALHRGVSVVHDAQRTSHHSLKYLRWHLKSMTRFFLSNSYREVRRRRLGAAVCAGR